MPPTAMGDFWSDLQSAIATGQRVESEVRQVVTGQKKVATVPTGSASISIPVPGRDYAVTVPMVPLLLGGGLLALLLLKGRR